MDSTTTKWSGSECKIPELVPGEQLDQKTFHQRYQQMPDSVKAELIEGTVYTAASALRASHASRHSELNGWLRVYKASTPGIEVYDNATTILGEKSEPQPDLSLAVLSQYGGQSRINEDGYIEGAPEFTAEVALSSEPYDLNAKLRDYERAGVREYLVVLLRQELVMWHVRDSQQRFVAMKRNHDGIFMSPYFGGLWLDPEALFRNDTQTLHDVLRRGLSSPEHTAFAGQLAQRKK